MKMLCAVAGLLLVLGCAPDSTSTTAQRGDEATSESSPAQEDTAPPNDDSGDGGEGEAQQVSVDLPGLPIGGSGAEFSTDAPVQCVDINWTGPTLPDGVGLAFTNFEVPPEFTWNATPCSNAPCVGGSYRITADTGGCTVSVTWNGDSVADPEHSVLRADAKAFCLTQTACDEVKAAADSVNEQTGGQSAIRLDVLAIEDGTSDETSDGTFGGSSEASSPSDIGSGA